MKKVVCFIFICLLFCATLPILPIYGIDNLNSLELYYDYDVNFKLYRVGEGVNPNEYVLIEPFSDYNVSVTSSNLRNSANTLASYISRDNISNLYTVKMNNGYLNINDLENGLYLLVGDSYVTSTKVYTPIPVLFLLNDSVKLEIKSDILNIPSNPTGPDIDVSTKTYKIVKEWVSDDLSVRPDSITIDVLRNGDFYKSVILSSANNWRYIISDLNSKDIWSVVETSVPNGYKVLVEQNNNVFTVTNIYERYEIVIDPTNPTNPTEPINPEIPNNPDNQDYSDNIDNPESQEEPINPSLTDESNLPQSGQIWMPTLLIGVLGVGLIILGFIQLYNIKKLRK